MAEPEASFVTKENVDSSYKDSLACSETSVAARPSFQPLMGLVSVGEDASSWMHLILDAFDPR